MNFPQRIKTRLHRSGDLMSIGYLSEHSDLIDGWYGSVVLDHSTYSDIHTSDLIPLSDITPI